MITDAFSIAAVARSDVSQSAIVVQPSSRALPRTSAVGLMPRRTSASIVARPTWPVAPVMTGELPSIRSLTHLCADTLGHLSSTVGFFHWASPMIVNAHILGDFHGGLLANAACTHHLNEARRPAATVWKRRGSSDQFTA